MDGGALSVTMNVFFLTMMFAFIPVLTQSISSPLDTGAVAASMVERMGLGATAGNCHRRHAAKHSSNQRLESCDESGDETMCAYASNHKMSMRHGRDLTALSDQQAANNSGGFRDEVEVLIAFKEGITEDSFGALSSWTSNGSSACHWEGVTCNTLSNRIIALELQYWNLVGSISPLLGGLQYLQTLDLSGNSFNGEIPISLQNCSDLSYLTLNDNNLTGIIPSQIGDLLNLKYLDLSNNFYLGGTFPASLGNCSLLQLFFLNFTNVGGAIPYTVGQLSHLEKLNLGATALSGAIPGSLGNCSSLIFLAMGNVVPSGNPDSIMTKGLSGELPLEMGGLTSLQYLAIQGSNLAGNFPGWLANLTRLTALALSLSSFAGEIPQFLGKLPLEQFDVLQNQFTGAFPVTLTNCSELTLISISDNDFEGPVPPDIGLLKRLARFSIGLNRFSGKIPSSLANCSSLTMIEIELVPTMEAQSFPLWVMSLVNLNVLSLTEINLQGRIPKDIGKLSHLQTLRLYNNNLTGPIPENIGNCSLLQELSLAGNQLSGELPPELWHLYQMQVLDLSRNFLTGAFPTSIGNLSQLIDLELFTNHFFGVISTDVTLLKNLSYLFLDDNSFSGYIPPSLGNLSAMSQLNMSRNQLIGAIPSSISNLTGLQGLYLFENLLQGSIPVEIVGFTQLIEFQLFGNSLSGEIPKDIGNLQSLQILGLNNNNFSGVVPDSLGRCLQLFAVDLSRNSLYGVLPPTIFSQLSSSLSSWNVSHNRLFGALPQELAQLTFITQLDFSANNFSGSIPSGLEACIALISLDLSVNNLSGSIPQTLGELKQLVHLNVSDNNLEGPIPKGGIFATNNATAASFFGNYGLCGSIVGRPCAAFAPAESATASTCKGFHCASIQIAMGCTAAGLLFVVVLLIWWFLFRKGKSGDMKGEEVEVVISFEHGLKISKEDLVTIMAKPGNVIGTGANSTVYKGDLGGDQIVAIKALSNWADDSNQAYKRVEAELLREVHILSKLRHRNILKVLGFFCSREAVALVSEYMAKGSLYDQLYPSSDDGSRSCELYWDARLNIAVGVAHGLVYLHNQFHEPIIHRDLKPSNIFLDKALEPKLGDFGASKVVSPENDGETTATTLCGTVGYFPPEYGATTKVSTKGDVYSYGVILLELLTRRHPIFAEGSESREHKHLVDWVLESFEEQPLAILDSSLIDESIDNENQTEQMKLLMRVGLLCTRQDPQNRPHMTDVLGMVNQITEIGSDKVGLPSVTELAEELTISSSEGEAPSSDFQSSG